MRGLFAVAAFATTTVALHLHANEDTVSPTYSTTSTETTDIQTTLTTQISSIATDVYTVTTTSTGTALPTTEAATITDTLGRRRLIYHLSSSFLSFLDPPSSATSTTLETVMTPVAAMQTSINSGSGTQKGIGSIDRAPAEAHLSRRKNLGHPLFDDEQATRTTSGGATPTIQTRSLVSFIDQAFNHAIRSMFHLDKPGETIVVENEDGQVVPSAVFRRGENVNIGQATNDGRFIAAGGWKMCPCLWWEVCSYRVCEGSWPAGGPTFDPVQVPG